MLMRLLVTLCLGILALALACGDDNPAKPRELGWTALGLEGSHILDLELQWPYLYAATAGDGLFRGDARGSEPKWELLGFEGDWCFAAKLLQDGILLAFSGSGVYRSEDAGRTWATSNSGLSGRAICVASCCDTLLSVTSTGDVHKSNDNGLTWSWLSYFSRSQFCQIACHPRDCGFLLASIEFMGASALRISRDGGQSWIIVSPSQLHDYYEPRGVAFDPVDERTAYVGTHGAVLMTSDGGATWTPIIETVEDTRFNAVTPDPTRRHHVFAGGHGYIYLSRDGGETIDRIEVPVEAEITDLECDGRQRVLIVGTETGVYRYFY